MDNFKVLFGRQNILNYTIWSKFLLGNITDSQLIKKFPSSYWPRNLINAFTSARQLSLSSAISIQSMPSHLTFWRSILILSCHLRLCFESGLFPSAFPTKILYKSLLSLICATFSAYLILHCFITWKIFGVVYRSYNLTLRLPD